MKLIRHIACFLAAGLLISGCAELRMGAAGCQEERETLYQVSTFDALLSGEYDGEVSCAELLRHGDFAIGTYDKLDGEMIAIDGKLLRVRVDGKVSEVSPEEKTPFASATFFDADMDEAMPAESVKSMEALGKAIDARLPSFNYFYAVRLDGRFSHVKTRSVPRQSPPYPPLVEVAKNQPVFEFHDIEGTVLGFRCPDYVKGVNVTGYHLHFLTRDGTAGGHLLDCALADEGRLRMDVTRDFRMTLPREGAFLGLDLRRDRTAETKRVEK